MAITVSVDHSRAVNHALYFNQLVSGFPELTSFLIFLKAHCADAGIDSAQMTSSLLTWTAVAYFRSHLLQLGTSRSSPGQVFLAFLDYFREGGAFDPRVHWLCPGHPCGIVQSATAATQSMWIVLDPFLSHERIDACAAAAAAFTGPHQEMAAFNLASSCYMTHVFRRSLGVVLQRVLYEYGDAIVPGGCARFILSPLDSKVNFAPLAVAFGEGAAAPRRFVQSIERLITTVLPHMMPHHHDSRHHAQGAQHSRCNN
ncbi:Hypothetical protein, putative [Bodo saltans]|uniref:Uncharacterized protein n=1 Tax=Bodo saltans TaxID=75058 RepID=A0A0S4IRD8_BODSA|nr:Hypothetical protein, putative [Bodo saltans]|eukprot:CUF35190.1 Hypothetical protein, putative [Bodo saltans]